MKKLLTTDLGGQPVYFKDFEFIQEQIRELTKATIGYLDTSKITILNGATFNLSTDGFTIDVLTEGWAYYQGEYFYIPVHSVTGSGTEVPKWNIVETYDSRGLKTFQDTSVGDKDVYLLRQLKISYVEPAVGGILFSETEYANMESSWTGITVQSPWAESESFNYRKNKTGQLELYGVVYGAGVIQPIGILPSEHTPDYLQYHTITVYNSTLGAVEVKPFSLATNGELRYLGAATTDILYLYFNHVLNLKMF